MSKHHLKRLVPISRKRAFLHKNFREDTDTRAALKFFQTLPWNRWWQEFMISRGKNGRMTYLTAYSFAKAKAKTSAELGLIYQAIGPRPIHFAQHASKAMDKEKGKAVPWLGDWMQIRARTYFYDKDSVDKMRQVVAERLDGLEAARGSALVILELIAKWMKYDDKIDEVFDGTPVVEGLSPAQQKKRSDLFLGMKAKTAAQIRLLQDQYLACHGIPLGAVPDAMALQATMQYLRGAALTASDGKLNPADASHAFKLLGNAMISKLNTFNMPPPSALTDVLDLEVEKERSEVK